MRRSSILIILLSVTVVASGAAAYEPPPSLTCSVSSGTTSGVSYFGRHLAWEETLPITAAQRFARCTALAAAELPAPDPAICGTTIEGRWTENPVTAFAAPGWSFQEIVYPCDQIAPFPNPPFENELLAYDSLTGELHVLSFESGKFSGPEYIALGPIPAGSVPGADTLRVAYLGGPHLDDVLFYDSIIGAFTFASVSLPYITSVFADDFTGTTIYDLDAFVNTSGTTGWTHVITGDYNGDGTGDLLFYRSADGLMRFYTTNAAGVFTPLTPAMYGTRGWTHMVVGDYNADGRDDVLWYRSTDGLMRFYEVQPGGVFTALTPAMYGTRNWTAIPSGDFDGNGTDDLLYYRNDGLARFYEVDATGTFIALGPAFTHDPGWDSVESGEFATSYAGVELAWYDAATNELLATAYSLGGLVSLGSRQDMTEYGAGLLIASGEFK